MSDKRKNLKHLAEKDLNNLLMYRERYLALKDRYLNQNEKHFYELCGLYFDEDEK